MSQENNDLFNYDLFTSEFLPFSEKEFRSVWYVWVEGCLGKIILSFENESLAIKAEIDDDTISLSRIPNSAIDQETNAIRVEGVWSKYFGQKFGWGWITINQQNYLDGVMLSFTNIDPDILLNVAASSINVFEISKAANVEQMREVDIHLLGLD